MRLGRALLEINSRPEADVQRKLSLQFSGDFVLYFLFHALIDFKVENKPPL